MQRTNFQAYKCISPLTLNFLLIKKCFLVLNFKKMIYHCVLYLYPHFLTFISFS
ncbi:hypothetical protein IC582_020843 [Cucumis melo]